MLKINGATVPTPAALRVTIADISGSPARNAAGNTVMDFMGSRRKLNLKWAHLTGAQLKALLEAVDACFFQVSYPDPMEGEEKTITCYCVNRAMGILRMHEGMPVWTEIEMEWMER